tara:strand:- start:13689 stop:14348 length:660 start_codon:yes stop_codon:yes gene_type:complete
MKRKNITFLGLFCLFSGFILASEDKTQYGQDDRDLYQMLQKMRLMGRYCDQLDTISLNHELGGLRYGILNEVSFTVRRFRKDQKELIEVYPQAIQSSAKINNRPFSEIYQQCDQDIEQLDRNLIIIRALHEVLKACFSAKKLSSLAVSEQIKTEISATVRVIDKNVTLIKRLDPKLDLKKVKFHIWSRPFNDAYDECKRYMREAIDGKLPESRRDIFYE